MTGVLDLGGLFGQGNYYIHSYCILVLYIDGNFYVRVHNMLKNKSCGCFQIELLQILYTTLATR